VISVNSLKMSFHLMPSARNSAMSRLATWLLVGSEFAWSTEVSQFTHCWINGKGFYINQLGQCRNGYSMLIILSWWGGDQPVSNRSRYN
jgi:hypothetical protein